MLKVLAKSAERTPELLDMHSESEARAYYKQANCFDHLPRFNLSNARRQRNGERILAFFLLTALHTLRVAGQIRAIAATTTTSANSSRAFLVGLIWQVAWRQQLWRSTSAIYPTSSCSSVSGVAQCKRMLW